MLGHRCVCRHYGVQHLSRFWQISIRSPEEKTPRDGWVFVPQPVATCSKVAGMCLYHPALQCHWEAPWIEAEMDGEVQLKWSSRQGKPFIELTYDI